MLDVDDLIVFIFFLLLEFGKRFSNRAMLQEIFGIRVSYRYRVSGILAAVCTKFRNTCPKRVTTKREKEIEEDKRKGTIPGRWERWAQGAARFFLILERTDAPFPICLPDLRAFQQSENPDDDDDDDDENRDEVRFIFSFFSCFLLDKNVFFHGL